MFSYLIRPFCFRLIAILALLFFVACGSGGGSNGGAVNNHSNNPQAGRLNATVFDDTVTLDWRLQGESFTITHSTNEASNTITVVDSQYTFSNLAPNSKHSFIVRSDTGEQALAYAYTGANIAQPSKISAIAFDSSAELAWEALPNVSSYTLYRSAQELSGYELYGTFNGSSALVTGLNNGQSYLVQQQANLA